MDSQRIALVIANHDDGRSSVATGYFVGPNLVLTVGHVTESSSDLLTVRTNFPERPEVDQWSDAQVIWRGAADIDALLLHISIGHRQWEPIELSRVTSGEWISIGYAAAAEDEATNSRKTMPIDGTFGPSEGQGPLALTLRTEQHLNAGEWAAQWKGSSGAPIFTGDGLLIGLIVEANRAMSNSLIGLPAGRLLDDIAFRTALRPSFLGHLPTRPWCLVVTGETTQINLVDEVADVVTGHHAEPLFQNVQEEPIHVQILHAIRTPENWAATVDALAKADFVVADVTTFEPAVMMLLGVRAVLRRGVNITLTSDDLSTPDMDVPFNVRETRVLSYDRGDGLLYDALHKAMRDGATGLAQDPNYLDLPAYDGVRTPRPAKWAEENAAKLLVLCPFSGDYSAFFGELSSIIRAQANDAKPQRMLDLTSPRLVGQALYEQIRWATRCIVDWTYWRPNVFFELGVRLASSDYDPLSIIDDESVPESPVPDAASYTDTETTTYLAQKNLLLRLFAPVAYDRANVRATLRPVLAEWHRSGSLTDLQNSDSIRLPRRATFEVAKASFQWSTDPALIAPHIEQRVSVERIYGPDQERLPEHLTLYSDGRDYDVALRESVRERWIAAWLYIHHVRYGAEGNSDPLIVSELVTIGRLTRHALSDSTDPRHAAIRKEIGEVLRVERASRPRRGRSAQNDQ